MGNKQKNNVSQPSADFKNHNSNKLDEILKLKDARKAELAKSQQSMIEETERLATLHNDAKYDKVEKNKNMELEKSQLHTEEKRKTERIKGILNLSQQQSSIDNLVTVVQQKQENKKEQFIHQLKQAEKATNGILREIIEGERNSKNLKSMADDILVEPKEMLKVNNLDQERDIINLIFNHYDEDNWSNDLQLKNKEALWKQFLKSELARIEDTDLTVQETLKKQTDGVNLLKESIKDHLELQSDLVGSLLENIDARNIASITELCIAQKQLYDLTALELNNRDISIQERISNLEPQRAILVDLVDSLATRTEERRVYLRECLAKMESNFETEDEKADFWITQYCRLLDSHPDVIHQAYASLNPLLVHQLVILGGTHCLPYLAMCDTTSDSALTGITYNTLQQFGVASQEDRNLILNAIGNYLSSNAHISAPSAPSLEDVISGPDFQGKCYVTKNECVCCMNDEPCVIFIPCGHLCTCMKCSQLIVECPMCRLHIKKSIAVDVGKMISVDMQISAKK